jgi:cytochrome P450
VSGRSAPGYRHVDRAREFEPTAGYEELRARCPVHLEGDHDPPFYVLSRFTDVAEAARQPERFVNRYGPGVFFQEAGALGTTDDPDHARHRRVLRAAFLPSVIDRLEPRIETIARELFDVMLPRATADFVEALAIPLPALAIAELLGVPDDERGEFHRWSTDAVNALTSGDIASYQQAKTSLEDTIERGVEHRLDLARAGISPPDDVLNLLAEAWRDGVLSRGEARHIGYQLLVAGHETTTSLLGLMLYRLLERPGLLERLQSEPELIPAAIEEALRFDSPVHGLFRTTVESCEVAGTTIPSGSKVQLVFASANRDPAQFERPDEFRLDRSRAEAGRHLAFGWGIHHCIGAPLARLTTRVAFRQLLTRTRAIELAGPPVRNDSFVLHGLTRLPIRWTTA